MEDSTIRNLEELGKNLILMVRYLMKNQNLLKLLYYTDPDPLADSKQKVSEQDVLHKMIYIVPRVPDMEGPNSFISLRVLSGKPTTGNSEFININLSIEVVTPFSQWIVKSENLRPFLIMGEIQRSLQGKTINGLGKVGPMEFKLNYFTEQASSYDLMFPITQYV